MREHRVGVLRHACREVGQQKVGVQPLRGCVLGRRRLRRAGRMPYDACWARRSAACPGCRAGRAGRVEGATPQGAATQLRCCRAGWGTVRLALAHSQGAHHDGLPVRLCVGPGQGDVALLLLAQGHDRLDDVAARICGLHTRRRCSEAGNCGQHLGPSTRQATSWAGQMQAARCDQGLPAPASRVH